MSAGRPFILGLTGSFGMGKSTVAKMFMRLGVPVHDADAVSRAVTKQGGAAEAELKKAFPKAFKDGVLDRKALGALVFSDEKARATLEGIIHPHVWRAEDRFLQKAKRNRKRIVVYDIPLMFETGAFRRVDAVLVVSAPAFVQAQRAKARGVDDAKFKAILASQLADGDKRARADFVINTGQRRGVTFRAVKHLVAQLLN
jgi:dephospho-CoA kinase